MSLGDIYNVDQELAEDGVWIDFGGGVEVKIRRANSVESRKVRNRLYAPYEKMRRMGREIKEDLQEKLNVRWIAEALIADWKGITRSDVGLEGNGGNEVPYTADNAVLALQKNPEFLIDVGFFAAERETFRRKEMEAAADELTTFPEMADAELETHGRDEGESSKRKKNAA